MAHPQRTPPRNGEADMLESRVARIESDVSHIRSDVADIKSDIREMRRNATTDFRLLFGSLITGLVGMAGLMAKGFHWL